MSTLKRPIGAWTLRFANGELATSKRDIWNLTCPTDWANGVERYVVVEMDGDTKIATFKLEDSIPTEEKLVLADYFDEHDCPEAAARLRQSDG